MNYQHKDLAGGRWNQLSLVEQMANIGSEVERTLNWRKKGNLDYSLKACERALELFDLTLDAPANRNRLKEVCRAREAWCDFIYGENEFQSTENSWKKYFLQFGIAARNP